MVFELRVGSFIFLDVNDTVYAIFERDANRILGISNYLLCCVKRDDLYYRNRTVICFANYI